MSDLPLSARPAAPATGHGFVVSANAVLFVFVAALAALLPVVRTLPIGPMYWDLFIYFDAAKRIFDGQTPSVDFFAPVGPLGYWLFAGGLKLFPNAQPLLLVDWSLVVVTAPLMALVLSDVSERSRGTAFALLLPFLLFSALPFNVENFSSFPGTDGFGIYNRQGARLLYVLAAALLFCEKPWRLGLVVVGAMLALFLTKITGFIAGGLLCAVAFLAGRVRISAVLSIAGLFLCLTAALEATTGVVLPYLADIKTLVLMNQGSMLPRFLQSASLHFGVFLPCVLLTLALLALHRRGMAENAAALLRRPSRTSLVQLADHEAMWLAAATFAALFYETQNTGSQAFIFVWPALLLVLLRARPWQGWQQKVVAVLVAASFLPTVTTLVERSTRASVGSLNYVSLGLPNLGNVGAVTQRWELMRRSEMTVDVYARNQALFGWYAGAGELPSHTLYAEPDYQLLFLRTLSEAVDAVSFYEMANEVRFERILNLGFVNPFPYLLDRHAPRFVSIGADPFRTIPPATEALAKEIRNTDLLLYARCPETTANRDLLKHYEPYLSNHRRVTFSRCWDGFVRNGVGK